MVQTTSVSSSVRPTCVGGLYEVCIGVPDIAASLAYYERFGCRAGRFGALDAASARALYGVDSPLRSLRLHHQDADHGLVRLMQWERPRNDGLGLDPNLRCVGSRWGVRLTASVLNIANHAALAKDQGEPINVIDPILAVIGEVSGEAAARPFAEPVVGVREMVVAAAAVPAGLLRAFRLPEPALRANRPAQPVPDQPAHARRDDDRDRRPPGAALLRRSAGPQALVRCGAALRPGDRLADHLRPRAGRNALDGGFRRPAIGPLARRAPLRQAQDRAVRQGQSPRRQAGPVASGQPRLLAVHLARQRHRRHVEARARQRRHRADRRIAGRVRNAFVLVRSPPTATAGPCCRPELVSAGPDSLQSGPGGGWPHNNQS